MSSVHPRDRVRASNPASLCLVRNTWEARFRNEPEPLPFAARHWLGAALLKAERVYRDELTDHPLNGWSLLGLHNALSAQGKKHDEIDADFSTAWSEADVWINESRF